MQTTARVVVIGGGVVGCSVLYHLAKFGWTDSVLLERDELTSGSTWHAAGGMHTINGDPNVAKLQKYTIDLYKEIEELSGEPTSLHLTGGVLLAATEARFDWLKSVVAKGRYLGIEAKIITPERAHELMPLLDPSCFVGALETVVDGHLDPSGTTRAYAKAAVPAKAKSVAQKIATDLRTRKSIMGIFDEGCMGMYNAIIPDELLFPTGVYKERLSQSALYAAARDVSDAEARAVYQWLRRKGMKFHLGVNEATDLTERQVLWQCKTYIAALRIADEFGCETIGIQYQQGLKDLLPASDLVEGILNKILTGLHIIPEPLQILYTDTAVLIGMTYVYLPLMVLPLFAAIDRFDFRLIEAGYDLYAGRLTVLRRVILPIIRPGIVAGSILVFVPSLGAYVTPRVLGGGKKMMIGNFIELQFGAGRNWPLGSALALILLLIVGIALIFYVRASASENKDG